MKKMIKQYKWMNKIKGMKNKLEEQNKMDEHNMFTTKSYVPM
jgi:hypothetical protein